MNSVTNLIIGGTFFVVSYIAATKSKALQKDGREKASLGYSFVMSFCIIGAAWFGVEALKSAYPDYFLD